MPNESGRCGRAKMSALVAAGGFERSETLPELAVQFLETPQQFRMRADLLAATPRADARADGSE